MKWKVNTSNPGKLAEYQKYLGDVSTEHRDLDEPDADIVTIVRFKASQFLEPVLVDDVSLEISDAHAGTLIRWHLHELGKHIGKKAEFICLIGIRREDNIHIYRGSTSGTIASPRGHSFGFNNYFVPEGLHKTFGEVIPPQLSPRKLAIDQLLLDRPYVVEAPIETWSGDFQKKS